MDLTKIPGTNKLRLLALVNDIFDMEKIEAGQLGYAFEPIDLSDVLPKAIKANEAYGIEFRVEFFKSSHSSRISGRTAMKYASIGSSRTCYRMPLTFPIAKARSNCCHASWSALTSLSVSDQGPGSAADFRTQIFEKFAQVEGSNIRRTSGTGLGLSISKAIVEKHDGQIDFESELGKGTTFFVDLPKISPPQ